jgi:sugar phosphate isomerase/epimerase
MTTSRREFLRKSAIALSGATLRAGRSWGSSAAEPLTGVQLYSVREDMQRDPLGTLERVAAIGYRHVEHAGYADRKFYGYSARELEKVLSDLGLRMPSGHTQLREEHWDAARDDFTDAWKYTVEDAALVGQSLVISPSMEEGVRRTYDSLRRYLEKLNRSGELCRKSGMTFGYHNEDFEFRESWNGTKVYDIILASTDPELVAQQLDIGNLENGGAKAIDVVRKYPGRIHSLHVKDEIPTKSGEPKYESTILGTGVVGVKDVIDLARHSGTVHFIVEQESYQGTAPLDCIRTDLGVMKGWGY